MKRVIRAFVAGVFVVIPFAITIYVVWWVGAQLGALGHALLEGVKLVDPGSESWWPAIVGATIVLVAIFLVGLATHFWLFRGIVRFFERVVSRLPGVKTIYMSVRDLMQLFGGESEKMGHVVLYRPPGEQTAVLGVLTNEHPAGVPEDSGMVAVYLPLSYMIGGPVIYVKRDTLEEIDMPVEVALKLAATAHIGTATPLPAKADANPLVRTL